MPVSRLNRELEISTPTSVQNGEGNVLPVCCPPLCPFLGCFWGAGRVDTGCCWEQQHIASSVSAGLLRRGRAVKKILSSGFLVCLFLISSLQEKTLCKIVFPLLS